MMKVVNGGRSSSLYTLSSAAEIAKPLPPREWLCEPLRLAADSLTLVAGYGYSRKSFFLQEIGLAISTGRPVFELFRVKQAGVLHLDYEQGVYLTNERYQRLARAKGVDLASALLTTATFPQFRLNEAKAPDVLRRMLDEADASVLLVDSLFGATSGMSENDPSAAEPLMMLSRVMKERKGACVLIHHASKPPTEGRGGRATRYSVRGTSALYGACDECWVLTGEKGQHTTVHHEKDRLRGKEMDDFGLDTEDVANGSNPEWAVRLRHLDVEQMREREQMGEREPSASTGVVRSKIISFLQQKPGATFTGSRTDLIAAARLKKSDALSALADMVSDGAITESGPRSLKRITFVGLR